MLLSPNDVLEKGLQYVGLSVALQRGLSHATKVEFFGCHFGSSPLVCADIWHGLQATDVPSARLSEKDDSVKGFKMFVMAVFFLWIHPRNEALLASRFGVCRRCCRGEPLWRWVKKIQGLKSEKIVWGPNAAAAAAEATTFVGSVDGTDCKIWEPKHPTMNMDTTYCSQKMKHAALKYEIVLDVYKARCLWINGPFKGGTHDMTVFRNGLKEKMLELPGKILIGDSIFKSGEKYPEEDGMFAPPRAIDNKELKHFKSRVRCRHETFNARLKYFAILSDCFRSTDLEKHQTAFEAICVIVQCQMDNGAPIFGV